MLNVIDNIAVLSGGNTESDVDIWFLPGFGESHLCFKKAFDYQLAQIANIYIFDPPGFGASPARENGITIKECAKAWVNSIHNFSASKKVVLVAHSVAGITAVETAKLLETPPVLLISVEGNLTKEDAYFSGQALNYNISTEFYNSFCNSVLPLVNKGKIPMSYYSSLQFADPKSMWTLGKSTKNYPEPGKDYMSLECPKVYYWCKDTLSETSMEFLQNNHLDHRVLEGLGHWPMIKSPDRFYSQLLKDINNIVL